MHLVNTMNIRRTHITLLYSKNISAEGNVSNYLFVFMAVYVKLLRFIDVISFVHGPMIIL